MKKNKDSKQQLFEMMEKINSNFHKPQFINENVIDQEPIQIEGVEDEEHEFNPESERQIYIDKKEKMKSVLDSLYNGEEFDAIDTLYKLMVKRSNYVNKDHSIKYREKAELLKGKIDFLFDSDHYDIIDKLDILLNKLYPTDDEVEI